MPWWKEEGIYYANNHEPLCFRLRRASCGTPAAAIRSYEAEHTRAAVEHLSRSHVNTIFVHWFKGDSWTTDLEDRASALKLLKLAREAGLHPCVYIQGGSVSAETFFKEKPEARAWCQIRADGTPRFYGGNQYQRFVPCLSNNDYVEFLKLVIASTIREADIDGYYFDNYSPFSPNTCYCEACKRGFQAFLNQTYRTPEERRLRYGFTDLSCLSFPAEPIAFNSFSWCGFNRGPGRLQDPLLQDWLRYRLHVGTSRLREFYDFTKKLKAECAVGTNSGFGCSLPMALYYGTDTIGIGRIADFTWCETSLDWATMTERDAVVTRVRPYKLARSCDVEVLTCRSRGSPDERALELAQNMAFNRKTMSQGPVVEPGRGDLNQIERQYLDWRVRHPDLFKDTETLADVAVLRSEWSLAYDYLRAYHPMALFEQTLFQSRAPFDIITDAELDNLTKYRVLVLCETTCLSDDQIAVVVHAVNNGLGLVIVGESGRRDEFCRERPENPWQKVFGHPLVPGDGVQKAVFGKGRAVFVPAVKPQEPMPRIADTYWSPHITHDLLLLPHNHAELIDAVMEAAGGQLGFNVRAPSFVATEFLRQTGGRILLPMVNYSTRKDVIDMLVEVHRVAARGRNGRWLSPDGDVDVPDVPVKCSVSDSCDCFVVPKLHRYGVLVLE